MKGLILSGGHGTRLRPITHTSAKQLVPIVNKPILFYGIEALKEAGIYDIGIIVGDTKDEIKKAVGDGSQWEVKITYIEQEKPLGLAHAVLTAEKFIGDSPFIMYLGDNVIKGGVKEFVQEFKRQTPTAQILLVKVPNPSQFGVAELEKDRVIRLVEKPKNPKSDLALVGVYLFDSNIFRAAKAIDYSQRGELEITDAIQWLVDQNLNVKSHVIKGWWKDTGKLEDLLEANRMMSDALETKIEGKVDEKSSIEFKVVIGKGAVVENSIVRGPAIIGENVTIQNAYIGPFTSISNGCKIVESEIEHSIVLEGSTISKIGHRISDSLIGKNVEILGEQRRIKNHQFMVGDNSKIELI
ncbi:MAG: glucose-1-phosphate thymidylyltransferase [Deltaproteobacteria bacterium RIFCSPHIGHO2_02_FULL_40_11]|nr:MAG: glucose-1-phosphate thymidylyltransferase [Deltaproteobacteria bacterium RIFCSPHIGHO2_02_FULL_40_11]